MKTRYKYIHFEKDIPTAEGWVIINNRSNAVLGYLAYYKPWKQYVFSQASENIVFNKSCLQEIIHFMDQLESEAGDDR
jgi:hypothetical protein